MYVSVDKRVQWTSLYPSASFNYELMGTLVSCQTPPTNPFHIILTQILSVYVYR